MKNCVYLIFVIAFYSSCNNCSKEKYETFFEVKNTSVAKELQFRKMGTCNDNVQYYVVVNPLEPFYYGNAFMKNDSFSCKENKVFITRNGERSELITFDKKSNWLLTNSTTDTSDTLYHYRLPIKRNLQDQIPEKEFMVIAYSRKNGIQGFYLLIEPNGTTNRTSKQIIGDPVGEIGVIDTAIFMEVNVRGKKMDIL